MKNLLTIFACVFALTLTSCDNKKKEEEKRAAELKAEQDSIQAARTAWDESRARIKRDRDEYSERRRIAAEERAKTNATYKDSKGRTVYNTSDVAPSYGVNQEDLENYIQQNITYPPAAQADKIEGTVFVDFVVGSDGTIRDAEVVEATSTEAKDNFSEEAIRVVSSMPKWKAGTQKGKAVDVRVSLPITFQVEM